MTKQRFKKVLDTLAVEWAQKDYAHAAAFFATNVKYGDPTRYRFTSRAELLTFFQNATTTIASAPLYRLASASRTVPLDGRPPAMVQMLGWFKASTKRQASPRANSVLREGKRTVMKHGAKWER